MGMELYANSAVARAVWDEADVHLGEVYGFSILEIVRSFLQPFSLGLCADSNLPTQRFAPIPRRKPFTSEDSKDRLRARSTWR